jgi:hypothetical protein
LWLLGLAVDAVGFVWFSLGNEASTAADRAVAVLTVVPFLGFSTVGAVIVARRPGNVVGWLCCVIGFALSFSVFGGSAARATLAAHPDRLPGGLVLHALGGVAFSLSLGLLLSFMLLLFPNGRLPSPRWRPIAWTAGIGLAVTTVSLLFRPGSLGRGLPANPLGIRALGPALEVVGAVSAVPLVAVVLASFASLVVRFRRGQGEERQQLKWFLYAGGLVALLPVLGRSLERLAIGPLFFVAVACSVPLSIGVAVLKYRLYDIDRLINRTLVYGLLTVVLGLCYVAGSLAFVLVAGAGRNPPSWLVAAATLAAAALFQPARRRIQAAVDRRFNRRRYDAAKTIQGFSARLRDQVDLDTLTAELLAVAEQTMEPTTVSLWLRPSPERSRRPTRIDI